MSRVRYDRPEGDAVMSFRSVVAVLVVLVVSVGAWGVVAGQQQPSGPAAGEPDLEVFVPDNTVTPDTATTVELQVANDGEITLGSPQDRAAITEARNVRVTPMDSGPIVVETESQAIGSVSEAAPVTAPLDIRVPADVSPGTYELDIELEYSYTERRFPSGNVDQEVTETTTETVHIEVDDRPLFSAEVVDNALQVGVSDSLTVAVENVGSQTATAADIRVTPQTSDIQAGAESVGRIDRLRPGEVQTVTFDMVTDDSAVVRPYAVDAAVRYTSPDGGRDLDDRESLSFAVTPDAEQAFSVDDIETTRLRVDETDGVVTGRFVNEGPRSIENGVVTVGVRDETVPIRVTDDEAAVGSLDPGESAPVRFEMAVTGDADPGSRMLTFDAEYEQPGTHRSDLRRSISPLRTPVEVAPERDEFDVIGVEPVIEAGDTEVVTVELEYVGDRPITNANARLFVGDQLTATDNSAFLGEMEPGDTTDAVFRVAADGDSVEKEYETSIEIRYDDADGDSVLADGLRAGIPVTTDDGIGGTLVIIGGILAVVLGGGALYRRKQ